MDSFMNIFFNFHTVNFEYSYSINIYKYTIEFKNNVCTLYTTQWAVRSKLGRRNGQFRENLLKCSYGEYLNTYKALSSTYK